MRRLAPFALLALAACTVGPAYQRPVVAGQQGAWIAPLPPGDVDAFWWRALGDPLLGALVDRALAANLDVREVQARLREARANRDAAAGRTVPELRATGSATENQLSANGQLPVNNIPGFARQYPLFDLGFDASWELDLWGGVRSAVAAADARGAREAARVEDVRLQTIAEVVRSYGDLRAAQARSALLREDAALRDEIATLTGLRFHAGESSGQERELAEQRAAAARAAVPEAEAAVRAAAYRLALLTGQPPESLPGAIATARAIPQTPALVAGGIRSELLLRRPDVRVAEADLRAATADIGVETANLYPRFSLTGGIGQQARRVGDLADGASTRFSIGPSFSWPIFSMGRIRAQIRAADARADAAAARYERAVLGALSDSETAANRYANARTTLAERQAALDRATAAADLAARRFTRGEDDRITLLDARSARAAAAMARASAAADALSAYVALGKALAGGVAEEPASAAAERSPTPAVRRPENPESGGAMR